MSGSDSTTQIVAAFKYDLTPQSPEHKVRLWFGAVPLCSGIIVILGETARTIIMRDSFSVVAALVGIGLVIIGVGVVFTSTMLAILDRGLAFWRKR